MQYRLLPIALVVTRAYAAWPPSADAPGDNIYAPACTAGNIPSDLINTIKDDFNNENSPVAQMIRNVCDAGKTWPDYDYTQSMEKYDVYFKIHRLESCPKFGFCEGSPFALLKYCLGNGNNIGGTVTTPFNGDLADYYQRYTLSITPKVQQSPSPTPNPTTSHAPAPTGPQPACATISGGFSSNEDLNVRGVMVMLCSPNNCDLPDEKSDCRRTMRRNGYQITATRSRALGDTFDNCQKAMSQLYNGCWKKYGYQGSINFIPSLHDEANRETYSLSITKVK